MRIVRVIVIDDHEIVRIGLGTLLAREQDIQVLGMAGSGPEGLELIEKLKPDVAVIDYSLGEMTGVEVCQRVRERFPEVPVIMLSTFLDDEVIHRSIQAGAKAYVYKDVEGHDLKRIIRLVADGQGVLDTKIAGRVMTWSTRRRVRSKETALSRQEVEVLRLVSRGASNRQIAKQLGLQQNTVKTYLRRAFAKLGCRNRAEAAAMASRMGLL